MSKRWCFSPKCMFCTCTFFIASFFEGAWSALFVFAQLLIRSTEGHLKNRVCSYRQEASWGTYVDNTCACGRSFEQWKKLIRQIHRSKVIDVQAFHSLVICTAQWAYCSIVNLAMAISISWWGHRIQKCNTKLVLWWFQIANHVFVRWTPPA